MKTVYITTPIYYVNAPPHLGHAYTTVAADALNRFLRGRGRATRFLTGTDEHGAKIETVAASTGKSPRAWADEVSASFRELWTHLDIRYDDFIRTTEPRHEEGVQRAFKAMVATGDITKGHYSGYYCLSCETYWTEVAAAEGGRLCPNVECRKPLQRVEEESYIFHLSRYQTPLLELYKANPQFLSPSHRAAEILRFVEGGLKDVSVSRTKVQWGVRVPDDPQHTVYVWFDALLNYITAAGWGRDSEAFGAAWPADVHIVGKEIYRFHAVIWPAMLMALKLELPRKVFAHGWWTFGGSKMSKSQGNIADPRELTAEYGVDAVRYFILREIPFGNDGEFSREALRKRYNADLANDLGNLVSRVTQLVEKNLGGEIPRRPPLDPDFKTAAVARRSGDIAACMERLAFSEALSIIWAVLTELNQYVDSSAPWKLAKTDPDRMRLVLFDLVWSLRLVTDWIEAFMPTTAARMREQLGVRAAVDAVPQGSGRVCKGPPLFPRKS